MRLLFAAMLLLFSPYIYGQNVNKQHIDEWLIKCDTAYKASKVWGYAFNNIVYEAKDSVRLDNDLKSLANNNLLSIDPFWNEELLPTTKNPGKLLVLIVTKGKQSVKDKEGILKTALSKYTKPQLSQNPVDSASKEPVLLINGKPISPTNCYAELSKLTLDSITDIYYSKHPVPKEYYGQNAKNGIIAIWIK
ncbi:hypothetical protein [Mucilaginibacter sp.]|jgi:hypothetical protein|uniref:hypothetical protein n=1 Tax=Mucilaginibacter sp. TaxID=1882438 RepID=UPI002635CF49|nr:hypothetical protein [Mucilaginibacter sp.]MDB5126155.1 hypothetical protein [Mucilaginibacter sp.]